MLPPEKIDQLVARHEEVARLMSENPDQETYVKLAREYAELDPVVAKIGEMKAAQNEFADLAATSATADEDEADVVVVFQALGRLGQHQRFVCDAEVARVHHDKLFFQPMLSAKGIPPVFIELNLFVIGPRRDH